MTLSQLLQFHLLFELARLPAKSCIEGLHVIVGSQNLCSALLSYELYGSALHSSALLDSQLGIVGAQRLSQPSCYPTRTNT